MKYDIILFDADGTLFDFARSEREAIIETFCSLGLEPDDEMVDTYSRINDSLWKKLERGEIEKKVLFYHRFELFFEQYGVEADPKRTAEIYMNRLAQKGFLLDGARDLCERLYGKKRLYIVTNGAEFVQRSRYAVSGIGKYFEEAFISDVIGHQKPSLKFFEYVESHIPDYDREKTLIVGDSLSSDMQGGIAAGIDTCWFNPERKTAPDVIAEQLTYVAHDMETVYQIVMGGEE